MKVRYEIFVFSLTYSPFMAIFLYTGMFSGSYYAEDALRAIPLRILEIIQRKVN
jgi:hypothetical protein